MPIYEYQCQACGELTEALQKISDPPLRDCPNCGKSELRKKISAAAFRLKGGGWYETDFKTSGRRNVAGDGSADKGEGGAGKDSGDSKGGDKTESKADVAAPKKSGNSEAAG